MYQCDIAWAAGLYEGEGTITASWSNPRGKGRYQYPRMSLKMKDKDVVERFCEIAGFGKVRQNGNDMWYWQAQGREPVAEFIGRMFPYLGERRKEQANHVLAIKDGRIPDEEYEELRFKDRRRKEHRDFRPGGIARLHLNGRRKDVHVSI